MDIIHAYKLMYYRKALSYRQARMHYNLDFENYTNLKDIFSRNIFLFQGIFFVSVIFFEN